MNCKHIILSILFSTLFVTLFAKESQTVLSITENKTLDSAIDLHVTSKSEPFTDNSTINLASEDAWLFFDNIRPRQFIDKYKNSVLINGKEIELAVDTLYERQGKPDEVYHLIHSGINCRIEIYMNGTVVIPHDVNYAALTVYTDENYGGDSKALIPDSTYKDLGEFNNTVRSFKLKRGYMATLANNPDGSGFSRVFVAPNEDIEISLMQPELDKHVSFIRTCFWEQPTKKGWCSSGRMWANEIELTGSTWYYSWSSDKKTMDNQEYVPIKQNAHWPSTDAIDGRKHVSHVLGYNEPDRPDQANMTVEQAIEGWPGLMKTGLRLGAPAIADNFNWLYNFMAECDKRNYRIDYVAIHSYWGGPGGALNVLTDGKVDVNKWYNKLKEVHDRTQRPIWITEWNNGANWTNETYWSNDTTIQQSQQKEVIEKILHMLDTCSFVERYSIYNWVEDKRALVKGTITQEQINNSEGSIPQRDLGKKTAGGWGNQYLTPAGVVHRDNESQMAYNPTNEVIPTYKFIAPEIKTVKSNIEQNQVELTWINYVGELAESYVVERKIDDGNFKVIDTKTDTEGMELVYYDTDIMNVITKTAKVTYRIRLKSLLSDEEKYSTTEGVVSIGVVEGDSDVRYGEIQIGSLEKTDFTFQSEFDDTPAVVMAAYSDGITNIGKGPTYSVYPVTKGSFTMKLAPWNYLNVTSLTETYDIPYVVAKKTHTTWGGLAVEGGVKQNVNNSWVTVNFQTEFEEAPVVFVTPSTAKSGYPVQPRVRNITKTGFEVKLTRELKITGAYTRENISYFAIAQGVGMIGGKRIEVGKTPEEVGVLAKKYQIDFGANYENPIFFSTLQTCNDNYTYLLKYNDLKQNSVEVFKVRETSAGSVSIKVQLDQVGWMIIGESDAVGVPQISDNSSSLLIYPSITSDFLFVDVEDNTTVELFNLGGVLVLKTKVNNGGISVSSMQDGMYFLRTETGKTGRFIKK